MMQRAVSSTNSAKVVRLAMRMALQEVEARYFRQAIGGLWAFISPLLLMGMYVVVFTVIFPTRLGGGAMLPAVTYILCGLVPWFTTAEILNRAPNGLIVNAALAYNPSVPLAAVPLKDVLVPAISFLTSMAVVLGLALFANPDHLASTPLLLLAAMILHLALLIGLAYLLSTITPFFRDLKDIVAVLAAAGMFLGPIFYLPDRLVSMPAALRVVIEFNPFSHFIWCYQDALFFGEVVHPRSWVIALITAAVSAGLGGFLYVRLRDKLPEVL